MGRLRVSALACVVGDALVCVVIASPPPPQAANEATSTEADRRSLQDGKGSE
jgi:hypothetical protein